jgi:two-component system cell cycle sensor histidine kinase PleC
VIVAAVRHEAANNGDGTLVATSPLIVGRRLIDVLGPTQPLTTFGAAAGVLEIPLADGSLVFATVRSLYASNGDLAILHGRGEALAAWGSDTALTVTLSATTGFVVLILGFAFHWQSTRAREADVIYETVRSASCRAQPRAADCGTGPRAAACSGRIPYSRSSASTRATRSWPGEINALVHPETSISTSSPRNSRRQGQPDRSRLPYAPPAAIGVAGAPLELVQQSGDGGPPVGIAVDITERRPW